MSDFDMRETNQALKETDEIECARLAEIKKIRKATNKQVQILCAHQQPIVKFQLLVLTLCSLFDDFANKITVAAKGICQDSVETVFECITDVVNSKHFILNLVKTKRDGSCGWRSVISLVLKVIHKIDIPFDYQDYYKFIIDIKFMYVDFINLLIRDSLLNKSTFLEGCNLVDRIYENMDDYVNELLKFDYMLTEFELQYLLHMLSTIYPEDFAYVNVILYNVSANVSFNVNPYLCMFTAKQDFAINPLNDVERAKQPTLVLYNGHYSPFVYHFNEQDDTVLMLHITHDMQHGHDIIHTDIPN